MDLARLPKCSINIIIWCPSVEMNSYRILTRLYLEGKKYHHLKVGGTCKQTTRNTQTKSTNSDDGWRDGKQQLILCEIFHTESG